ncbi:MAG: molecular chaperone DnaJ [Acidobacteria bacterium]|nr:molecular chaperone DnaJ [Acidobacteriota bacterium]
MATGENKDYYKTLGVKRSATQDDIRKAYRRLARKYHPDVNPGDKTAEDKFKEVQEANEILGDEKKRKMYDQYGFYSPGGFPGAGPQPGAGAGGGQPGGFDFSGFDFSEYAQQAGGARGQGRASGGFSGGGAPGGGGFGDLFSQFFKSAESGRARPQPKAGEDLEYTADISFWDAIRGTSLRLNIQRYENCAQCGGSGAISSGPMVCPECEGKGQVNQTVGAMKFNLTCPRCGGKGQVRNSCPACSGEGRIAKTEQVEVRIPPGAQNGSRLRVPGKGNAGAMGAPSGDLYIITRVGEHRLFKREGDDIRVKAPITPAEAILGAKIEIPTIDGKALLKIPPATNSGKTFRLRERGVLNRRTNQRGDQYIEVQIVVPPIPDENTKELMREFTKLNPEDPRKNLFEQVD